MALASGQPHLVQRSRKGENGLLYVSVVVDDCVDAHVVVPGLDDVVVDENEVKLELVLVLARSTPCWGREQ